MHINLIFDWYLNCWACPSDERTIERKLRHFEILSGVMEYLKRHLEGVGSVFSLRRTDSIKSFHGQEFSVVDENSEKEKVINASVASEAEAEKGREQHRSSAQTEVNGSVGENVCKMDTIWPDSEKTSQKKDILQEKLQDKVFKKLSHNHEQKNSPEIAQTKGVDFMREKYFVTVATEASQVSESTADTEKSQENIPSSMAEFREFRTDHEVTLEETKGTHASEQAIAISRGKSADSSPSTAISNTAGDAKKTKDEQSTLDQVDDIEDLIIATYKEKNGLEQDVRRDVKDAGNMLDEAAIMLEYPDQKKTIQGETNLQETSKEENLVALKRDKNKDKDYLETANVNELLKLDVSVVKNQELKRDEEGVKREEGERLFHNGEKSTESAPELNPVIDIISTTVSSSQRGHKGNITVPPTLNASSAVKCEIKFYAVNSIKELKTRCPLLMAQLKQVNKKLRSLRDELLKVQESDEKEAEKDITEEDLVHA